MQTDLLESGVKSSHSGLGVLSVDTLFWMDHGTCFEHNAHSPTGRVERLAVVQVLGFLTYRHVCRDS